MLVPTSLVDRVAGAKITADHGSAALEQLAFADFLQRGELDRHLRRMRPIYRRRRDALVATLAEHLPDLRVTGTAAGLHLLAWLPDHRLAWSCSGSTPSACGRAAPVG
jgi:GntR family transcriptional regulator / MocR family aminotransferase